jgi:hypothetical protein
MKQSHTLFILVLLSILSLASCSDDFDINTVKGKPKLILYCMPAAGDSTAILLMRSLPVNQKGQVVPIDGAHISYSVNGRPATVVAEGNGHYKAVARQAVGDRISIEAEADGLPAVSAQTTILAPVPVSDVATKDVTVYSDYWEESENYLQLTASFTDPADTKDYYAVQVKSLLFWRNDDSYGDMPDPDEVIVDTTAAVCTVYTESDPVLKKLNSIDYDFGYDNNAYENFYVFTDDDFNGKTYTLHLNLDRNVTLVGSHYVSPYYYVELYHITPEFYHFVSTIGSIENSDLAKAGLSNITPNVGNVRNGIGMAAGFASAKSKIVQHVYDE